MDARDNWWGTERREEIERLIFDREDAGYLGRVRYDRRRRAPAVDGAVNRARKGMPRGFALPARGCRTEERTMGPWN